MPTAKIMSVNSSQFSDLANSFGTPLYIYDASIIKQKIKILLENLPARCEILYAIKANPHNIIVQLMKSLNVGADVASGGELEIALQSQIPQSKISFVGPGKTVEELKTAIMENVAVINVESVEELVLLDQIAASLHKKANVGVRINPKREFRIKAMKMGGGSTPFGIDEEQLPHFFAIASKLKNIIFKGIHVFFSSQILDYTVLLESFENTFTIALAVQNELGVPLEIVNFGGGFGIPYFKNEKTVDIEAFGKGVRTIFEDKRVVESFPQTRFLIESGRFLVGECGFYITKVLYRKKSRGKDFVITDGGMHHHLAASGNLGSVLQKNYDIRLLNKLDEQADEKVTVVGLLCTPLDVLANNIALPRIEPGDLICICNSGAYGLTSSPVNFLSHPAPQEIVIDSDNKPFLQ